MSIPEKPSGQGAVCTPGSWDQQEQASPAPEATLLAWALATRVAVGTGLPSSPQHKQVIRLQVLDQTLPPGTLKDREELRPTFFTMAVLLQVSSIHLIFNGTKRKKGRRKLLPNLTLERLCQV